MSKPILATFHILRAPYISSHLQKFQSCKFAFNQPKCVQNNDDRKMLRFALSAFKKALNKLTANKGKTQQFSVIVILYTL